MTNIVIDCPSDLEIYPSTIPDLCYDRPLIISGRYKGNFPDKLEAKGTLADMSNFIIDIEVQHTQDIPLEKVLAKKQIEAYTTQAWLSQDKSLEDKVTKISLQTGTVSEYTQMILLKTEPQVKPSKTGKKQGKKEPDQEILKTERINVLRQLGLGFGDMVATFENIPPGFGPRPPSQTDKFVKGAGNCCVDLLSKCCCMCCIQACSKINNGCSVVLTQICGVLTCTACCE
ncbi:uncharacterized protein LOC143590906 [Bidens hawaiensis]|uniref:uncharacterized protein LOC143590906 n=1 Tax=Bidens hawaiensis TaxID=980011 RepID=UPI00404923D4